jgi:hypothetical protein
LHHTGVIYPVLSCSVLLHITNATKWDTKHHTPQRTRQDLPVVRALRMHFTSKGIQVGIECK